MDVTSKLIKAIKEFRERTGLGLQLSKQCVEEADLDVDLAIGIARERGFMTYSARPSTTLAHGVVGSYITDDQKRGAMVELLCYTDFAARTEEFKEAARLLAQGLVVKANNDCLDMIIESVSTRLKEPVRLHRYEVFDLRD
jgi:elongation factor Ts